jgi:glycerate kinase
VAGSGAAGGLAGGLVVAGARIVPGFDLVATLVGLNSRIDAADLVVTGEGRLDATSWKGKVVGGVVSCAAQLDTPVVVIAGQVATDAYAADDRQAGRLPDPITDVVDLTLEFGAERASADPSGCSALAVASVLRVKR